MMRDDKLVRVAIRSGQTIERVVWIYGAILESAAEIDEDGKYDFDAAEAAYFLRSSEADVVSVVDALQGAGRICDGAVVNWGDRQFKSDRSAERQARYRERKKHADAPSGQENEADHVPADAQITSLSRHGDAPETETETETETDSSDAKASSLRPWACPVGVDPQVWKDFLGNRKRKQKSNSPTAWKRFNDDLARVSLKTGIPPPTLIEHAAASGWAGIYDPNARDNANERPDNPTALAVQRITGAFGTHG
jgi:hypothetical protein